MCISTRVQVVWPFALSAIVLTLLLIAPVSAQDPGLPYPNSAEVSDQKTGSVLFFNYCISAASSSASNTEIVFTNSHPTTGVTIRLFFISGNGAVSRSSITLSPLQTLSFLASDIDPGVIGYMVALAVDGVTGCPINFNYLMGDAHIKLASGQMASLSAVAVAAQAATPASCAGLTTLLSFDNVNYNRLPRVLVAESIVSRVDGNDTLLVLNRVGGSLAPGGIAASIGTLTGSLFNDVASEFPFSQGPFGAQLYSVLTNNFPATNPPFQTAIPSSRTGWLKLFGATDIALLGAVINTNPNAGASAGAFNYGQNLTHETLTSAATLTVPIGFPDLIISKTHTGNFSIGGTGSYTITVTNNGTGAVGGNTIVRDTVPGNLSFAGFSGTGWGCTVSGTVVCSNTSTVNPNASYPPLTLNFNVGAGTPTGVNSITNIADVLNYEEPNVNNNRATDPTTVNNPVPMLTNISPTTAMAGGPTFMLTVNGANFVNGSVVRWNDIDHTTTYISPTMLTAVIHASDIANAGIASVKVFNPAPGGGLSNMLSFTITQPSGLMYYPLPRPIRLFDTRAPIPGFPACAYLNQQLQGGVEFVRQARITCDSIPIPPEAQAIVGNATVVFPSGNGYIILWPDGEARPPASNLNYVAGQVVPNAFTLRLGTNGQFRVYSPASTDFIIDITGYFAPPKPTGLYYHPLPRPIRLFDTRGPIAGFPACEYLSQPLTGGAEFVKQARINCDSISIPSDAQAIVGNATVVYPSGNGYIIIWPDGQPRPPASNLNYVTGQIVPNAFTVGLGSNGQFRIYSVTNTDFIVDITGYYSPSPTDANGTGLLYSPLTRPIRLFDTRGPIAGFPACEYLSQPLLGGVEFVRQARITCDNQTIPSSARAIVANATVIYPSADGYVIIWPDGQLRPPASNLNYVTGQIVPNAFTVGLSSAGQFRIYPFANMDFLVDIEGFYAP